MKNHKFFSQSFLIMRLSREFRLECGCCFPIFSLGMSLANVFACCATKQKCITLVKFCADCYKVVVSSTYRTTFITIIIISLQPVL